MRIKQCLLMQICKTLRSSIYSIYSNVHLQSHSKISPLSHGLNILVRCRFMHRFLAPNKALFFQSKSTGPFVQSIVSLTSLSVVKMLTVLLSTVSNSQVFLLKKMSVAFANHIF